MLDPCSKPTEEDYSIPGGQFYHVRSNEAEIKVDETSHPGSEILLWVSHARSEGPTRGGGRDGGDRGSPTRCV